MGAVTDKPPKLRRECLMPLERKATEELVEHRGELGMTKVDKARTIAAFGAMGMSILLAIALSGPWFFLFSLAALALMPLPPRG